MPPNGGPKVRRDGGDQLSMINFVDFGVSRRNQDGSGSGRERGIHVAADVADQQTLVRSEPELSGSRGH